MAGPRGSVRVVCVTLSDEPDQAAELTQACNPIPLYIYDGAPKPCTPIVTVYAHALDTIDADFFVFAHQDVRGNIPQWVQNGIDVMDRGDLLGVIGWRPGKPTLWRNTTEPTTINTCDECCFGLYKASLYTFDPRLKWTSYSHDLCHQATSSGHRALVVPNKIGHAQHRHGPWFVATGIYQNEQAYVRAKWRGIL